MPCMTVQRIAPMQMLAGSDPDVYTTSEKASKRYEALGKGDRYQDYWDYDWDE